jgi:Tol biopolymer transport system component
MRLLGLVAALAAAGLYVFTASAARLAAPQGIAFSDSDGSLHVARSDGTGVTTVYTTDGTIVLVALSLSPSGTQVLALEDNDGTEQLALVPAGGGTPTLVAGTQNASDGQFTPDGASIVFSLPPGVSDTLPGGIYTVPLAGGTPRLVITTPDGSTDSLATMSPNGKAVAFLRDRFDGNGNEITSLDFTLLSTVAPSTLVSAPMAVSVSDGGRLSFSPDGKWIVWAGNTSAPGIFLTSVAGGATSQLTRDSDYWPSFTADGTGILFGRDALSANADDNAANPIDPVESDVTELWTMSPDGSNQAPVAEGDFEDIATSPYANASSASPTAASSAPSLGSTPSSGSGGSGGSGGSSGTSSQQGGYSSGTTGNFTSGSDQTATTPASAVRVAVHGNRYTVTWKGRAAGWKVTLRVGSKTFTARVRGSVHAHAFVLRGVKGRTRADVAPAR